MLSSADRMRSVTLHTCGLRPSKAQRLKINFIMSVYRSIVCQSTDFGRKSRRLDIDQIQPATDAAQSINYRLSLQPASRLQAALHDVQHEKWLSILRY